MRPLYYTGLLVKEIDIFAFPRTGSHFFRYCAMGLFDLVCRRTPSLTNTEAIERQTEINPSALYGLDLREPGVAYQPAWINSLANGMHGRAVDGGNSVIVLIRDPIATAYSLYRVHRDRWHGDAAVAAGVGAEWIGRTLKEYVDFYTNTFDVLEKIGDRGLLVRYEDLVQSPAPLVRLVEFCGIKPKLQPEFVHFLTRFDVFAKPGERTFYRSGDNDAWRNDEQWMTALKQTALSDFSRFGYDIRS